jgi:AcrR family transcriptional regulator
MAEIAARADAKIGSLYRFFPSKDAVAEALMQHYAEVPQAEYDAVHVRAAAATPEELADILIDLLAKLALSGVRTALKACAPDPAERMEVTVLLRHRIQQYWRRTSGSSWKESATCTRLSREQVEETSSRPRSPFRCCPLARRAGWPWRETDRGGRAAGQQ